MADLHIKALGNSALAIAKGECYASIDSCSEAGEAAMRKLRARYNIRVGAVYLRSQDAVTFADSTGLSTRFN